LWRFLNHAHAHIGAACRAKLKSWSARAAGCYRRAGTVTIEFALVATALFGLLLFALDLAFQLYEQLALDYATWHAARLLEVDSAQTLSGSSSGFQSGTFCPSLAPLLSCGNLVITLRPVSPDYLSDSQANPVVTSGALPRSTTFNPGLSGSLMLLQVTYLGPAMSWPLNLGAVATYNGATGSAIVSNAPFANEY